MLLRKVTFDISKLVNLASLNHRIHAEDAIHGSGQCLAAIETKQCRAIAAQISISQIREQCRNDFRVFRFPLAKTQNMLRAVIRNAKSNDDQLAAKVYAINKTRCKIQRFEASPVEIFQLLQRCRNEVFTDGTLLDAAARTSGIKHTYHSRNRRHLAPCSPVPTEASRLDSAALNRSQVHILRHRPTALVDDEWPASDRRE